MIREDRFVARLTHSTASNYGLARYSCAPGEPIKTTNISSLSKVEYNELYTQSVRKTQNSQVRAQRSTH